MTHNSGDSSAFDALASSYDDAFSKSTLGRLLRKRVWRQTDRAFAAGERVLDVGCGTGEDAVHLAERGVQVLATDASPDMIQQARTKIEQRALSHLVELRAVAAESLEDVLAGTRFDGVLSNFGVVNCVQDLNALAAALGTLTRPHGRAFLCVMGPWVPWEWGWFLLEGEPKKAFRRLRSEGVDWRGVRVRYPTVGEVCRVFESRFRPVSARALGALLPPTYAEKWAREHPDLIDTLADLESRLEAVPPFAWLADHYLLELVRR